MADWIGVDVEDRTCSVADCERIRRAKGFCKKHYYALRTELCTLPGCLRQLKAKGMCNPHYREFSARQRPCPECGVVFRGHERRKYCSLWCKAQANRSPMRKAVEAGDSVAVIAAAKDASVPNDAGCWIWRFATNNKGYGVIGQGGKGGLVHRHVAQAAAGRPIGKEPVHHRCATTLCVNPDHLQLVTERENTAEMLSRNFYVHRIAELEAALALVAPGHPAILAYQLSPGATTDDGQEGHDVAGLA